MLSRMKNHADVAVQPAKPSKNGGLSKTLAAGSSRVSIRDFTTHYQLSHDTLTRMTGFSLRAVSNWVQGAKPSDSAARRFAEVKRLLATLERLISAPAIGTWLK